MNPVRPSEQPANSRFVEIAKDQPEYRALPAFMDEDGLVLTEWDLTVEERMKIAAGGKVRLWIHTFGKPLQPLQMEVTTPTIQPKFVLRLVGDRVAYFAGFQGNDIMASDGPQSAFKFDTDLEAREKAQVLGARGKVFVVEVCIPMGPPVTVG